MSQALFAIALVLSFVGATGSIMTLALHKVGAHWRIAGWAWAKGKPVAAWPTERRSTA